MSYDLYLRYLQLYYNFGTKFLNLRSILCNGHVCLACVVISLTLFVFGYCTIVTCFISGCLMTGFWNYKIHE